MMTNLPTPSSEQPVKINQSETSFKWLIILLALLGACILALYFMNFSGSWGNQADFGAFGDYLGGVLNPILGFATVGLLIWSLKMQMIELSLSRQELALTRNELAETKKETELSRRAMEAQVAHLEKEATLTELQRLIDRTYKKHMQLIEVEFPIKTIKYSPVNTKMIHCTYGSFLREKLTKENEEVIRALKLKIKADDNIQAHLRQIRNEAHLIADLALDYYSINHSSAFVRTYLLEVLAMLIDVNNYDIDEMTVMKLTELERAITSLTPFRKKTYDNPNTK